MNIGMGMVGKVGGKDDRRIEEKRRGEEEEDRWERNGRIDQRKRRV